MTWKSNSTSGDMKSKGARCKGAADIYHKAVETFGEYRDRVQPNRDEKCAKDLVLERRRKSFLESIIRT